MKSLLIVAMVFVAAVNVHADGGTDVGGGGRGVVCTLPDGKERVELLDLYESRAVYGLTPETYEGKFEAVRDKLLLKLLRNTPKVGNISKKEEFKQIREHFNLTLQNFRFLPPGDKLKPVDDSHEPFTPGNCKIEQLAHWRDANLILVNGDMWKAMDSTNKVALVLHEILYRNDRMQGLRDSVYARKAIGYLFSTTKLESMDSGLPHRHVSCMDKRDSDYKRYLLSYYPACSGDTCGTIFQFDGLDGQTLITKTTVYFPALYYNTLIGVSDISLWGTFAAPIESIITSGDEIRLSVTSKKGELAGLTINRTLNTNGVSSPVELSCRWANGNSVEPEVQEANQSGSGN